MAKVSGRSKKTIVDDEISDKTASASESASIALTSKRKRKSPPRNAPLQRSSPYRGVTRHRWTGRYEAHLWDKNSWNDTQTKKGRQGLSTLNTYMLVTTNKNLLDLFGLRLDSDELGDSFFFGPDFVLRLFLILFLIFFIYFFNLVFLMMVMCNG
ncbi:hypothetical protein AXX17_AT1G74530 [Arabidopsis thaliana]|uniref:AP2/ERF domain-containing protein n=1 Tax=Arabidopsis thaliana TaxID=3702 RepID=A0A178WK41_ARATH|nr:hypothetical protein AXX17_AT1G74530 [Arabidopsis thaliana]